MKYPCPTRQNLIIWSLFVLGSLGLVLAAWRHWAPMGMTEVLGFITGALCVWLTVKENIWNWPIGIANSAFFLILFLQSRLFADSALQAVYIVLGFLGWYWWLHGGQNKTALPITRTSWRLWLILAVIAIGSTYGMTLYLRHIQDAAPFWDALTTVLSLVAQYLLTKKKIENWFIWMTADVIYVWLYIYKQLYLTGGLYVIFFAMCVAGVLEWRRLKRRYDAPALPEKGVPTHV